MFQSQIQQTSEGGKQILTLDAPQMVDEGLGDVHKNIRF